MTQPSGSGFSGRLEFGEKFGGVFVEGADTSLAAKPEQTVPVKGIDGVVQAIPGNETGFERISGHLRLRLGLFLRSFGEEGLEGGLGRSFFLLGVDPARVRPKHQKQGEGERFQRRRRPPFEE